MRDIKFRVWEEDEKVMHGWEEIKSVQIFQILRINPAVGCSTPGCMIRPVKKPMILIFALWMKDNPSGLFIQQNVVLAFAQ